MFSPDAYANAAINNLTWSLRLPESVDQSLISYYLFTAKRLVTRLESE
jgi:hypothetical protein